MTAAVRWACLAIVLTVLYPTASATAGTATNPFKDGELPTRWVVIGPFPNPEIPAAERTGTVDGAGFDTDYLESIGGEAKAEIDLDTRVAYEDEQGEQQIATTAEVAGLSGLCADFAALYSPSDRKVAYAYCEIKSEQDQTVHGLFGSDDRAMVWVNGERVHRFDANGRGHLAGDDHFQFDLKSGTNRVLVKVENGTGGWCFSLRPMSEAKHAEIDRKKQQVKRVERVQDVTLTPNGGERYIVSVGALPTLQWSNPELMEQYFGPLELKTRWFDGELNEVETIAAPGRYAAYAEATTLDGRVIRRGLTVYATPNDFAPHRYGYPVSLPHVDGAGIRAEVWDQFSGDIERFGGYAMLHGLYDSAYGAMTLATLHDRQQAIDAGQKGGMVFEWSPDVLAQEHQLKVKAKVLGVDLSERLSTPSSVDGEPARTLQPGTLDKAGFDKGMNKTLDKLAKQWAKETGIPFTLMVTRRGVIAHHGAYGEVDGEPIDTHAAFDIASISKLLTGVTLVQLLEQDLIDLDAPIGTYLPDLPTQGAKAMTVRQCMSHSAGTRGHVNWGGFNNPWFENIVANGLENYEPGKRYEYNGLSMNLVGRAMEMQSGKSFPRLMQEHLYQSLGCDDTLVVDTSTGTRTTARDLAIVGQLLLNRGSYGDRFFFSPEAMELLTPVRLGDLYGPDYENQDSVYGLGNNWIRTPHDPNAPADGPEEERSLLGYHTLTHGSATQSVLRIDFDHDMVISMTRPAIGPDYSTYFDAILFAIAEHLQD